MLNLREILQPGITGKIGWRGGSVPPLSDEVVRVWKTACWQTLVSPPGNRAEFLEVAAGRSYHTFSYLDRWSTRWEHVLLHAVLPLVAACSWGDEELVDPPTEPQRLDMRMVAHAKFVECPLKRAMLGPQFVLLQPEFLDRRFEPEAWMAPLVDPAAWEDMHYFKPERVGDVIFNHFD